MNLDEVVSTGARSVLDTYASFLVLPFQFLAFIVLGVAFLLLARKHSPRIAHFFEALFPKEIYGNIRRVDVIVPAMSFLLFVPIANVLVAIAVLWVGSDIAATLAQYFGQRAAALPDGPLLSAVQFVFVILFGSFCGYWWHYLHHKAPFFWAMHRAHHSADYISPLSHFRFHPLEYIFGKLMVPVNAIGLGIFLYATGSQLSASTAQALVVFGFVSEVLFGFLGHSHIQLSFGWFNRIYGGPVMHQIHHSAELHQRDRNFGGGIMIWDWMFGTLYIPRPEEKWRRGISEDEIYDRNPHATVKEFYLEPLRNMAAALKRRTEARA